MNYGLDHYEYQDIYQSPALQPLFVAGGIPTDGEVTSQAEVDLVEIKKEDSNWELLLREGEQITIEKSLADSLEAPVSAGQKVGEIIYKLDGNIVASSEIRTAGSVKKLSFSWCIYKIIGNFLIKL